MAKMLLNCLSYQKPESEGGGLAPHLQLVEVLGLAMALLDGAGELQQPVRERRLAVVDVRDDREVPDPLRRVQRELGPGHRGAGPVLRRRLRREQALRLLERVPGQGRGGGDVTRNPASGSPERGGAGHPGPRAGARRPAAGARVLGGDLAEQGDGLRGSGLWTTEPETCVRL